VPTWKTGSILRKTPPIARNINYRWPLACVFSTTGIHLIIPSIREIDGEERFKVVGVVGERLFTGVFVWRDNLPRFISVRRSSKGEERAYYVPC
jgi:uncharacterized DUF497 family protein